MLKLVFASGRREILDGANDSLIHVLIVGFAIALIF